MPSFRLRCCAALLAMAGACGQGAHAQATRLDDSSSPRPQINSDFRNAQMLDPNTINLPFGHVEYRLATAAYVGKQARIYYVIPLAVAGLRSPMGMQVQWRSSGLFQGGMGRPGDRVLVWSGVVRAPWITESFDLQLRLDQRQLQMGQGGSLRFESYFEIETQP